MSVEIIEDNSCAANGLFLPPCCLAVRKSVGNKWLVFISVLLLLAGITAIAYDLLASVLLLPIAILILAFHLAAIKKSKRETGSYGLKLLSAGYIVSAVLCGVYGIVRDLDFMQPYIMNIKEFLFESSPEFPEPFQTVIMSYPAQNGILFSALALVFLAMGGVFYSLKKSNSKNHPFLAIPIFSTLVCFALAGLFGYNCGKIFYDIFTQKDFPNIAFELKLSVIVDAFAVMLFSLFAVFAGVYCIKISVEMKKVKNAV